MLGELATRLDEGAERDTLVWRLPETMLCASSAAVGGGLGARRWVLNAQVSEDYHREDLDQHVSEMAAFFGLEGAGVALLTAAPVRHYQYHEDRGVEVQVTVGLSRPTWAASEESETVFPSTPGTVNIVAFVPVRLDDGAMLNAFITATEAKTQALVEAGVAGTGTASDALCVLCPLAGDLQPYAGPRSLWGGRLARAVYHGVIAGARATP